jgi:hypothetical protein
MQLRHRTLAKGCYQILLALVILTSAVHAGPDKPAIRREVKRHIQKLLLCYETHGVIQSRIVLAFVIGVDGRVTSANATGGGKKPLRDCVVGVFKRMRFPRSQEPVKVTYPLHIHFAGQ